MACVTQYELAESIGVREACIGAYECGKRSMETTTCMKISKALGIPAEYLMEDTDAFRNMCENIDLYDLSKNSSSKISKTIKGYIKAIRMKFSKYDIDVKIVDYDTILMYEGSVIKKIHNDKVVMYLDKFGHIGNFAINAMVAIYFDRDDILDKISTNDTYRSRAHITIQSILNNGIDLVDPKEEMAYSGQLIKNVNGISFVYKFEHDKSHKINANWLKENNFSEDELYDAYTVKAFRRYTGIKTDIQTYIDIQKNTEKRTRKYWSCQRVDSVLTKMYELFALDESIDNVVVAEDLNYLTFKLPSQLDALCGMVFSNKILVFGAGGRVYGVKYNCSDTEITNKVCNVVGDSVKFMDSIFVYTIGTSKCEKCA